MTDNTTPVLSIEQWAKRRRVSLRKAYRWVASGKVTTVERKIKVRGILANTPKPRLGKSK